VLSLPARRVVVAFATFALSGCSLVQSATKAGMLPILNNGVDSFVAEPDLEVAEGALVANMKLIEGVAATYPDDPEPTILAAMARGAYAFGFIQDELDATRLAYPDEGNRAEALVVRALSSFRIGVKHALHALDSNGGWSDAIAGRDVSDIPMDEFKTALAAVGEDDITALFWLAFNWGGQLQVRLDPVEAVQLPKIEAMIAHVLEVDERIFYDVGPNLLAGTLAGFRSPALGGTPDIAVNKFSRASELGGGSLLADVLIAQLVYAQTEKPQEFETTLKKVIDAEINPRMAAFESLAKRKACRLLANSDQYFLEDPKPLPEGCAAVPHKMRLREPE